MADYGRKVITDTALATTPTATTRNQRGQIMKAMPENGWIRSVHIAGGKVSGQPNVTWRGAVFDVDGAVLDERFQYTSPVTVSNVASTPAQTQEISANLASPVMGRQGVEYGLAWAATGGRFAHGYKPSADNPSGVANTFWHIKDKTNSIPDDPFGAAVVEDTGGMALWASYEPNSKPTTTTATMVPQSTVASASLFEGDWDDIDETWGDAPLQFRLQVRQVGQTTLKWDSTQTFTDAEQTAKRFSSGYAGTAITANVAHEWRYQVSDRFGVWSSWSSWVAFTVNTTSSVAVTSGSPSGKQESQTPASFTGVWSQSSALATDRVRVRLVLGGLIERTSGDITKAVANGGTIIATWAETGFTSLPWGWGVGIANTGYQMQARATNGQWSPWSALKPFTVNAAPSLPLLTAIGSTFNLRPLLTAKVTDLDDTTGTGFSVNGYVRNVTDGGANVNFTATYNATTGLWQFQTTATEVPTLGKTYAWAMRSTDGTVTTAYSAERTFSYQAGPGVTQVAPVAGSTIATHIPTISFTVSENITTYNIAIYDYVAAIDTGTQVMAPVTVSGTVNAGTQINFAVPAGILHHGRTYIAAIGVTGTPSGLTTNNYNPANAFTVNFGLQPAPANYQVSGLLVGNDVTPSAVLVTWDEADYPSDKFGEATLTRRLAGTLIDEPDNEKVVMARWDNTSQHSFTDYYPASGKTYTYALEQTVLVGTDWVASETAEADVTVALDHVVINSVLDGTIRAGLRYGDPIDLDHAQDWVEVQIWGQEHPYALVGDYHQHIIGWQAKLHDDSYSSAEDDLAGLRTLHGLQNLVCWRDQYGDKVYGWMTLKERKGQRDAYAIATIGVRQTNFTEGVD